MKKIIRFQYQRSEPLGFSTQRRLTHSLHAAQVPSRSPRRPKPKRSLPPSPTASSPHAVRPLVRPRICEARLPARLPRRPAGRSAILPEAPPPPLSLEELGVRGEGRGDGSAASPVVRAPGGWRLAVGLALRS